MGVIDWHYEGQPWGEAVYQLTTTGTNNITMGDPWVGQAREWLRGLRYQPEPLRPPWEFGIESYAGTSGGNGWPGPGNWLTIKAHCADSVPGGLRINGQRQPGVGPDERPNLPLMHYRPIPLHLLTTQQDFRRYVLRLICEVHAHEAMENLRDEEGERVVNPHPSPYEVLYHVPADEDTMLSWSATSAVGSTI